MNLNFKWLSIAIIIVIIALIALILSYHPQKKFAFELEVEDIFIYSDLAHPRDLLKSFADYNTFIISPELDAKLLFVSSTTDNLLVFLGVLEGSGKRTISLIRQLNERGELISCRTNFGDLKTDEEISIEKCNEILNQENAVKVLIFIPNKDLKKTTVILEDKKILVKPKGLFDGSRASLLLLKTMFSNAEEILNKINEFSKKLNQKVK